MSPPKFDLVVEDCDTALALDPKYIKALNRRGTALEGLQRWEEALRGMSFWFHIHRIFLRLWCYWITP
jgi:import receptor subunit TOM70